MIPVNGKIIKNSLLPAGFASEHAAIALRSAVIRGSFNSAAAGCCAFITGCCASGHNKTLTRKYKNLTYPLMADSTRNR